MRSIAGPAWWCYAAPMIGPPADDLTNSERDRLELVEIPGPEDVEAECVYRFRDTGEFIPNNEEEEAVIRVAFPGSLIRRA